MAKHGYTKYYDEKVFNLVKKSGFTLIELVVVIALLGILAAAALPRMMKSYDGAHESNVTATGGALASAVILVRSQWVTNGARGEVDSVAGYGDDSIATSIEGWPTDAYQSGGSSHSTSIASDAARCARLWQGLLVVNAPTVSASASAATDYLAQAPGGSICRYTYQNSGVNSLIEYNVDTGSVVTIL